MSLSAVLLLPYGTPLSPAPLLQGTSRQTFTAFSSLNAGQAPYSATCSLVMTLLQLPLPIKALQGHPSSRGPTGLWAAEIQDKFGAAALR